MCLLGTRTRKGICTSSTRECSTKTRRREESTGKASSGMSFMIREGCTHVTVHHWNLINIMEYNNADSQSDVQGLAG